MLSKKTIKYFSVFFVIIFSTILLPVNTPSFASTNDPTLSIIAKVLSNKTKFFDTDNDKNVYLTDFLSNFNVESDLTTKATEFAVVDLDGDGTPEVVLEMQCGGSGFFEVLHYSQGDVYGYNLVYRAMEQLQKDGSFISSGSAADNYICKLRFLGDTVDSEKLIWSESDLSGAELYFKHDVSIDDNAFHTYTDRLNNDVDWYKYTKGNITKWVTQRPVSLITKPLMPTANIIERQKYLDSLSYLFSDLYKDTYTDDRKSANDKSLKSYESWDSELNKIYQLLKKKLSASDMKKLRTEERLWIKIRDQRAEQVYNEWNTDDYGKAYADEMRNNTLRDIAKRRTYQLIDLYYDCSFYN